MFINYCCITTHGELTKQYCFQKDKKLSIAKQDNAKQTQYALPCFETVKKQSFAYDTALNVRDKILNDFRRNTKYQFMRAKTLFTEVLAVPPNYHWIR